jgi:hypothetical protein
MRVDGTGAGQHRQLRRERELRLEQDASGQPHGQQLRLCSLSTSARRPSSAGSILTPSPPRSSSEAPNLPLASVSLAHSIPRRRSRCRLPLVPSSRLPRASTSPRSRARPLSSPSSGRCSVIPDILGGQLMRLGRFPCSLLLSRQLRQRTAALRRPRHLVLASDPACRIPRPVRPDSLCRRRRAAGRRGRHCHPARGVCPDRRRIPQRLLRPAAVARPEGAFFLDEATVLPACAQPPSPSPF